MARSDISKTKMVYTMFMNKNVREGLTKAAKEQGRSVANLVNYVLADYLRRNNYME